MLAFKIWLLNLNKISDADGTTFGKYLNELFPVSSKLFDFYKVFNNNPDHHMLYSTKYLEETSVLKLLQKHFQYQSMFRYMHVRERS